MRPRATHTLARAPPRPVRDQERPGSSWASVTCQATTQVYQQDQELGLGCRGARRAPGGGVQALLTSWEKNRAGRAKSSPLPMVTGRLYRCFICHEQKAGASPPRSPVLIHLVIINERKVIATIGLRRGGRWAECDRSLVFRQRRLQLRSKHCLARGWRPQASGTPRATHALARAPPKACSRSRSPGKLAPIWRPRRRIRIRRCSSVLSVISVPLPILGRLGCPRCPFMAVIGPSEILRDCCCAATANVAAITVRYRSLRPLPVIASALGRAARSVRVRP